MNHWLRPDGPPDPVAAGKVNSQKTLTARLQDCIATRGQLPNAVAVDFTAVGDLYKTVNRFNAAIARQSEGHTDRRTRPSGSCAYWASSPTRKPTSLRRLPKISERAGPRGCLGRHLADCRVANPARPAPCRTTPMPAAPPEAARTSPTTHGHDRVASRRPTPLPTG